MPFQSLALPDADVGFDPHFFSLSDADRLFAAFLETTGWKQDSMRIFGRVVDLPRLTAWYGDPGTGYVYSGIVNEPQPWTPALCEVKQRVESASGVTFNSVLLNRYRSGSDSMGWHADDEKEFGTDATIASLSFGASRTFQLRHKTRKELKTSIELTHGSLLVMRGSTQHHWMHRIPKTAKPVGERINLTYRYVHSIGSRGHDPLGCLK